MSESDFQTIPLGTTNVKGEFEDIPIRCLDCAQEFIWSVGEQAFYHDKQLLNPPKRCRKCKKEKIRRLEAVGRARMTGQPHKIEVRAACAKCETVTTVPFYPSQGRPVYCRSCYVEMNSVSENGSRDGGVG